MKNLKRYNTNAVGMSGYVAMFDFEHGEWVKFSDIKDILKTNKAMSAILHEINEGLKSVLRKKDGSIHFQADISAEAFDNMIVVAKQHHGNDLP